MTSTNSDNHECDLLDDRERPAPRPGRSHFRAAERLGWHDRSLERQKRSREDDDCFQRHRMRHGHHEERSRTADCQRQHHGRRVEGVGLVNEARARVAHGDAAGLLLGISSRATQGARRTSAAQSSSRRAWGTAWPSRSARGTPSAAGKTGGAPTGCSWFSCSLRRGRRRVITDGTDGRRRVVGPAGHKGVYRWYCRR